MADMSSASGREIAALVSQLADFATRARARTRLVLIGGGAVPALAGALSSPVEGMAWSAARALGDIGGDEAVGALIGALSIPTARDAALDALKKATGRDLGDNADAWRRAVRSAGWKSAEGRADLSDEELAAALASSSVTVEKGASGYTFIVQLSGGRRQKVDMLLSLKDADGALLVAFYTECGPAAPGKYEWALKTNLKLPFGSIAVRETAEGAKFVMVDAYLRDCVSVRQLARALEALARRADSIEQSITGVDRL